MFQGFKPFRFSFTSVGGQVQPLDVLSAGALLDVACVYPAENVGRAGDVTVHTPPSEELRDITLPDSVHPAHAHLTYTTQGGC
jgi:hypothetical protein